MAIKNKDGTPYRLSKPNPIMKQQSFWDKFVLHNFTFAEFVSKYAPYEEINRVEPEEISVAIHEAPMPLPRKRVETPKSMAYCLPAQVREVHDSLYNEHRAEITYGQQVALDVVILEDSDLTMRLWSKQELGRGSILFLAKDKRWWRVEKSDSQGSGWTLQCVPSDITPSFDREQFLDGNQA